jgi:hypothetical protein
MTDDFHLLERQIITNLEHRWPWRWGKRIVTWCNHRPGVCKECPDANMCSLGVKEK